MSSGHFFAIQEHKEHSTLPWSFATAERFATAEEAIAERDRVARQYTSDYEYRAVEVHVTTEISVVE